MIMVQKMAQKETYNEALAKARKTPAGAVTPSQADPSGNVCRHPIGRVGGTRPMPVAIPTRLPPTSTGEV